MKPSPEILLVEDELLLCWQVEEALQKLGYSVEIVTTGREGLAAIEGPRHYDLLITNIKLPDGFEGWELAKRARELRPNISVLFVTGDSSEFHAERGVPDSILVSKPYRAGELEQAVLQLLAQQSV